MRQFVQNKFRQRTLILALILSAWIVGIFLRLIQLQVIQHTRLKAKVIEQNQNKRDVLPRRGTIYDRNGIILARSLPTQSVFLTPSEGESLAQEMEKIQKLKPILGFTEADFDRIQSRIRKGDTFIWVKRKIDPDCAQRTKSLELSGIFLQEETKRLYPLGKLASHVLGGVGIDDEGLSGVEYKYNSKLHGKKGKCLILRDARNKEYYIEILKEAEPGQDLVLALDETIQYIAEKILESAVRDYQANWGTVIISHPSSGEILALASYPNYNPNNFPPSPEEGLNRAISYNFEPGSTFKIITAAAARETRAVNLSDSFDCREGKIQLFGSVVRDHKLFGILTFPQALIHSSNVGMIKVGQQIGENSLYQTIESFKFGQKTGVDLPGEETGIFRPLNTWSKLSLPHLSIGYEISVTALQILEAMNVIANKGIWVPPRIVKDISEFPEEAKGKSAEPQRIISERTASELAEIFEKAVEEGTGRAAQIPGFKIAGKTGTAQKYDPALKEYISSKHLASFVGFVPADKPVLSMIVVIDEPKIGEHYGGVVAAPVFREIASRALRYLGIRPQNPPAPLITAKLHSEGSR
jgi:cell division protein FtsI (penicillin-binding protein 3)